MSVPRAFLMPTLLALGLGAPGCPASDDDDSVAAPDDDDGEACAVDADCRDFAEGLTVCDAAAGACVQGDRNNDRDEAQLLPYDSTAALHIAPAGDVDWFRLNGTEGDLLLLSATADDAGELDTVIVYVDASGNEIGFNDDFERVGDIVPNSRLYIGVPTSGTYYVSVQDRRSWVNDPGDPPEGGEDFAYSLTLARAGGSSGVPVAVEPNDSTGEAVEWPVTEYSTNYSLGGLIAPAGDVDVLRVPVTAGETLRLYAFPNTGTAARPAVTLRLPDGVTAIKRYTGLGWTTESRGIVPVLETGDYLLTVEDDNGTGGFDHWYYLHAAKDEPDPAFDVEAEPNGASSPEALPFLEGASGSRTFFGRIGAPGDEDHFAFPAAAGARVTVRFERTLHGETTNLEVRVLDPEGAELTSGVWSGDAETPAVQLFALPGDGLHRIVVREQDPGVGHGGRYYRATVSIVSG